MMEIPPWMLPLVNTSPPTKLGTGSGENGTTDVPQTGDDSHLGLWLALLALCMTGLSAIVICTVKNVKLFSVKGRKQEKSEPAGAGNKSSGKLRLFSARSNRKRK